VKGKLWKSSAGIVEKLGGRLSLVGGTDGKYVSGESLKYDE